MSGPAEREYPLGCVRTLRVVDVRSWTGREECASWCEWDHPGETPRSFSSIISSLEADNWPRFVRPGSTCLDIGAHSGDTAIPLGLFSFDKASGKKGCVLAVEPNPDVFPVLEINLALNSNISDFHPCKAAVTHEDVAQVELADHGNANCNGGILQGSYSEHLGDVLERTAKIRYFAEGLSLASLLARFLTAEQQNQITFIKTDCEGYDKEIIRGAREYLQARQPTLFAEWFSWFTPEDDDDFFRAIEEVDYVALHPRGLHPINRGEARVPDVLCVHKTRMGDVA